MRTLSKISTKLKKKMPRLFMRELLSMPYSLRKSSLFVSLAIQNCVLLQSMILSVNSFKQMASTIQVITSQVRAGHSAKLRKYARICITLKRFHIYLSDTERNRVVINWPESSELAEDFIVVSAVSNITSNSSPSIRGSVS